MPLEFLGKLELLLSLLLYFLDEFYARMGHTFYYGLYLRAFRFGDEWLLSHYLRDEFVDVGVLGQVEQIDAF